MSKCENCGHKEVCYDYKLYEKGSILDCPDFQDKSLCVELPCICKDYVWCLESDSCKNYEIVKRIIMQISVFDDTIKFRANLPKKVGWERIYDVSQFGKTVFLTKEEAQNKLKEMGE